ncbi:Ldh family oxidoreductase [Anaerosinus massiliensis]|uniref:Ldh family oxidoreductase n=1 Tax=Massilibacillus massiliensis TaxID=1806837 RepID=UPI000A54FBE4|nr:Ldh family oxidoreductase [Massilibacillus massiliensis]
MNHILFSEEELKKFIIQCFCKVGVPLDDSDKVADNLLKAELWGISTHGISRLSRYLMRIKNNTINPTPKIKVQKPWPALLTIDGDNGLGAAVMCKALDEALQIADEFGICAVGVNNSNHFGMAGFYCEIAAKKNYISIGLTNALAALAPWGGKKACLGTNPIAFGFPRKEQCPIIIDMATSVVARGKIISAAKKGIEIPEGWAMDQKGNITTDPNEALMGMILPMAGPKGYALSMAVDLLSGIITNAQFGTEVAAYKNGETKADVGHFFMIVKADAFISLDSYYDRIESFCQMIKNTDKIDGVSEIYLPGEREQNLEKRLRKEGIGLSSEIVQELEEISKAYGINLRSKNCR